MTRGRVNAFLRVVAAKYLAGMVDWSSITDITTKFSAFKCIGLVFMALCIERMSVLHTFVRLRSIPLRLSVGAMAAAIFLMLGNFSAHPFIYFQF